MIASVHPSQALVEAPSPAGPVRAAVPLALRFPNFYRGPADAAAAFRQQALLVVGCGSLGWPVALMSAAMQPRQIILCDSAKTKPTTSLTTLGVPPGVELGKAALLARQCKDLYPPARVCYFAGAVQDLPLLEFAQADVVFLCTDNIPAEFAVAQKALLANRPVIHGAVHGPTLIAQIRCYGASSACPACGLTGAEWRLHDQAVRFSCDGSAAGGSPGEPTMSTISLCAMAAAMMVNTHLKWRLRLGNQAVADTLVEFCAFNNRTVTTPLARNPACRCDHTPYHTVTVPRPLAGFSAAELVRRSGLSAAAQLSLDGLAFAQNKTCSRCGAKLEINQFLPLAQLQRPTVSCAGCGQAVQLSAYATRSSVSLALLGSAAHAPLHALGGQGATSALLRSGDTGVLLYESSNP